MNDLAPLKAWLDGWYVGVRHDRGPATSNADVCMCASPKSCPVAADGRAIDELRAVVDDVDRLRPLVAAATEFTFRPDYGDVTDEFQPYDNPEDRDAIVLSWRGPSEAGGDPDRWAIRWHGDCWSRRKQKFVYERSAGNRTESFIADTRFGLEEAMALVPELLQRLQDVKVPELRRLVESWAQQEAVAGGEAP